RVAANKTSITQRRSPPHGTRASCWRQARNLELVAVDVDLVDVEGEDAVQLTALLINSATRFTFAAFNSLIANIVGHIVPSSRLAWSSNVNVAYRVSHFEA